MRKNHTLDQLRVLNELFANTGASNPECAEHVRHVLRFFSEEQESDAAVLSLSQGADRLAQLHFGSDQERELVFAHWAVSAEEGFSPLWMRQALIAQMKQLSGSRAAFLLITGLRQAVCPAGSYWTRKRQEYYDCIREYISELACSWSTPRSNLQLALF